MKKSYGPARRWLSALLALALLCCLAGCDDEPVSSMVEIEELPIPGPGPSEADYERRDYRVVPKGDGTDTVTVMLYLCGSDLESEIGAATADLNEIGYAEIGEQVNVIVETGGASEWHNSVIPSDTNMRWRATNEGLEPLEDAGLRDMTDPDNLADFIRFCAQAAPADRYMLVLWDHGGGTTGGFAHDENFPDSECMTITEIDAALGQGGVVFDFVGFDACLMATAETAYMLEDHADFMVASQRVEPGNGWHYTPWITALSENSSINTLELGTLIADSFVEHNSDGYYANELTLSVLDLTFIDNLFGELYMFFDQAEDALVNDQSFVEMSRDRYDSRAMADNYDQVDIGYLVGNMNLGQTHNVLNLLDLCVAYNAATIENHSGLCLYFPYSDLQQVEGALEIFNAIGIGQSYQDFIASFASLMVGGQMHAGGGAAAPHQEDDAWWAGGVVGWLMEDLIDDYSGYYQENSYSDELVIDEKDGYYALSMPDEDWELITDLELSVFVEVPGQGWIDLGSDNVYEFDDDGDLMVDFDYTWVSLNGRRVCFYAEEYNEWDDGWLSYGYSPCTVNGTAAELIIAWDSEDPEGYVPGYRYQYEGSITQKGVIPLNPGDEITFLCDFYTDEGGYEDSFEYDALTVDGPLAVSYDDIGDVDCEVYYVLYDIYGNTYWTESVFYA